MTKHEQAFRAVYPRARIESQKRAGPGGKRYYLVRRTFDASMYSGCGNTKDAAWRDAALKLSPILLNTPVSSPSLTP